MSEEKTIEELVAELKVAEKNLLESSAEEIKAGNRRVEAQNLYNGLTKKIDAALLKMRRDAPSETEWYKRSKEKEQS